MSFERFRAGLACGLLSLAPLAISGCGAEGTSEFEPVASVQEEITQTLRQPFAQPSYICQSYRGYSHSSNYSLDIGVTAASCNAGNNDSGGKPVVAPASGTVTKLPTTGVNAYLCIQLDGGGAVSLGHVKAASGITVGTKVQKGQQVATIAHASDTTSGNGGIAHLHFDAFDGTGCYNGNPKPFTGAFKLDCAPDLPFNATYGYYNGTKLTPCAEGPTCDKQPVSGAENELFKDMPPGSTAKAEAEALYDAKITSGCEPSPLLYCPDCTLTRVQAVTMLVRAANISTASPPATPSFIDVPKTHSAYAIIEAAVAAGITSGCGDGKFCPDAGTTRGALATFVARTLGWSVPAPATPTFSDVPLDHTHSKGVEAVSEYCVSSGCGSGKYCPSDVATRATAAIFIARAFDLEGLNPCGPPPGTGTGGSSGSSGGSGAGGASGGPAVGGSAGAGGSGAGWSGGSASGGTSSGSGGTGAKSSADGGGVEDEGGCGCFVGSRGPNASGLWLALLAIVGLRLRRR